MPHRRSAWVLNLDAEYELETIGAHTPSARTLGWMPELVRALAPLFGPEDVVLGENDAISEPRPGRAWCPTPWALRRLVNAGAIPIPAPDVTVLRRVNHRRFNAELGQTLPGARFVTTFSELRAVMTSDSPSGQWLLKRPLAFAGRGRRRVARGPLDPSVMTWVEASLRDGDGLQVEPWVERIADYGWHGFLSQSGVLTWGEPTRQECDDAGTWRKTTLAIDLQPSEAASLRAAGRVGAEALLDAGYFGPFGIDAYRWRDGTTIYFNPRGEINARYSMGWAIGMHHRRVDLEHDSDAIAK